MLIVCPACASEYEIAADRLGTNGRSVRCAACRETWFIAAEAATDTESVAESPEGASSAGLQAEAVETMPDIDAPAASPAPESDDPGIVDEPMPYARRTKTAPKKPARARAGRALSPALAAGLAVVAIVPLALLGRSTVVRAMPQTAGLFAGIGLPVNLRGVSIRDVAAFQTPAEGDRPGQLVVEGDLVGVARERVDVPEIAIELRDAHDQPLYRWTVPAPRAALETAETARFRATLSAPPSRARAVQVRFADAKADVTGHAEAGKSEAGKSEAGKSEAGHPEVKPAEASAHAAEQRAPAHGH